MGKKTENTRSRQEHAISLCVPNIHKQAIPACEETWMFKRWVKINQWWSFQLQVIYFIK